MARVRRANAVFAFELASPINTERRGRRLLGIRFVAPAIENIIRGNLDDRGVDEGGCSSDFAGRLRIDAEGKPSSSSSALSTAVYAAALMTSCGRIASIASAALPGTARSSSRPADGDKFQAAASLNAFNKASGELSVRSRDEDFHFAAPSLFPA